MTKQEERQTLAKIEKLIAAAGEDSYIGMAFAGCVQMAKDNIENDFGNSMQEYANSCKRRRDEEAEARARAEKEIELLSAAITRKSEEIDELRKQLKAEKQKQLPLELYGEIYMTIVDEEEKAQQDISKTAEILSYCADTPNDIAVASGLKHLKEAHQRRSEARRLLAELKKYEPK